MSIFDAMDKAVTRTFKHPGVVTIEGITGPVDAILDARHFSNPDGEAGGSSLFTSITVSDAEADQVTVEETTVTIDAVEYVARDKRRLGENRTTIDLWKKA